MTKMERPDCPACGCDDIAQKAGLLSLDAALELAMARVIPVATSEAVSLADAKRRILAKPVLATCEMPPFDNSAMDGFAICTTALEGEGPWTLTVQDRLAAGDAGTQSYSPTSAVQIFTGAPVPAGFDAVVMQENVTRQGNVIQFEATPLAGQHIRRAGEDVAKGDEILPSDAQLGVRELAAAAGAGADTVKVRSQVRVALLVSGSELADSVQPLGAGMIHDVNSPMMADLLDRAYTDLFSKEVVADKPKELASRLAELASKTDLIVTTGGVSVGEEDHLHDAVTAIGGNIIFAGVAVKPGKPITLARIGKTMVVSLPGNPVSALVTWLALGLPVLQKLAGIENPGLPRRQAVAANGISHRPGRCEFRPARIKGYDALGRELVEIDEATHSARLAPLVAADGLVLIPADAKWIKADEMLEFMPFQTI